MALKPSTIISIVYSTIYALIFSGTSIYCLWDLKQIQYDLESHSNNNTKPSDETETESADKANSKDADNREQSKEGKDADDMNVQIELNEVALEEKKGSDVLQEEETEETTSERIAKAPKNDAESHDNIQQSAESKEGDDINVEMESNDVNLEEKKETDPLQDTSDNTAKAPKNDAKSQGRKVYDGNFMKDWMKSIWHKKKIYLAIMPHIFDQATDAGVIWEYYNGWNKYDATSDKTLDPFWFFIFGIFIIIFQRIISTITIYAMTNNPKAAALQFLDLLMVKAVWINYILGLEEPSNPQRYIELLEACFESSPQIILSMGYILKSAADGDEVAPIVVISTIFSLWSLTSKVASDDKVLFRNDDEYKEEKVFRNLDFKFKKRLCFMQFNWQCLVRVILWRFCEISSRVCLSVLLWMNLGGLGLVVILGAELVACFILCVIERTPDLMGNMMYISFATTKGYVRYFWLYRVLSFYVYMIIVTVFAMIEFDAPKIPHPETRNNVTVENKLGLSMLIYTWISGYIWPYVVAAMVMGKAIDGDAFDLTHDVTTDDRTSTSRDLISYMISSEFAEVRQLLKFGYVVKDDYTDYEGYTLLHAACEMVTDDMEFFEECFNANPRHINAKTNVQETPLHRASTKGKTKTLEFLISNGADIDAKDNQDRTVLHKAVTATKPNVKSLQYLIEHGVDVNAKDNTGNAALHYVAMLGIDTVQIMECLVEHGSDVNCKNEKEQTVICYAAEHGGNVTNLKWLIKNGAETDHKDKKDKTLLDYLGDRTKYGGLLDELKKDDSI